MEKILELKNINKIYGTTVKTQVLTDINLSFEKGSFNSIIGQSGSGKSTLLNIIGTLDKPTSGEVIINGVVITSYSIHYTKLYEIASLLGETAAETKIALAKLKESITDE